LKDAVAQVFLKSAQTGESLGLTYFSPKDAKSQSIDDFNFPKRGQEVVSGKNPHEVCRGGGIRVWAVEGDQKLESAYIFNSGSDLQLSIRLR
jgi:hypothetical protein